MGIIHRAGALSFMQKSNAKPANVEIKPSVLHEAYMTIVI